MAPAGVFSHHHSQQPTTHPDSRCISPFVWQQNPKMPIFRPKNNTKNYTYLSSIFNPNISSKVKSLHLQQSLRPWYLTGSFPLNVFRGLCFSHFIRPSPQVASFTPKREFWVIQPSFQVSSHPVLPAKYRIH